MQRAQFWQRCAPPDPSPRPGAPLSLQDAEQGREGGGEGEMKDQE